MCYFGADIGEIQECLGRPDFFLCLLGSPPRELKWAETFDFPHPGEIDQWSAQNESFHRSRSISNAELRKLIGELGFPRPVVFGKCGLAVIRPLYNRSDSTHFASATTPNIDKIPLGRIHLPRPLMPRIALVTRISSLYYFYG